MPEYPGTIYITAFALEKLNAYAMEALPTEVGGLARLQDIGGGNMIVVDVRMFEQEASGASFQLTDTMMTKFALEMSKAGKGAEIPEWCSIVHSHPVGMSAHMSSVDVKAIERFAMDQDAFSLIIPASHNGNTPAKDLLMHYCVSNAGRAGKIIIRDTPVRMATTTKRVELGNTLGELLVGEFGDALSDAEKLDVARMARLFATDTIPGLWDAERAEIRREAKENVPKLIKRPQLAMGYGQSGHYYPPNRLPSYAESEWGDDWHGVGSFGRGKSSNRDSIETMSNDDLEIIASGIDPSTGLQVGRRRMRRAKTLLDGRTSAGADAPIEYGDFVVGEYVTITDAGIERLISIADGHQDLFDISELYDTPSKISAIDANFYYVEGHAVFAWEMESYVEVDEDDEDIVNRHYGGYLMSEEEVV